jgi:hypothetical protein
MRFIIMCVMALTSAYCVVAQQVENAVERRMPLTEPAIALDRGVPALEGTLRTTALVGAPDNPVTNIRLVIKNVSSTPYNYVSGLVSFYDASGVRCGEGIFKADVLALNESVETDTPGIRVRCAPASWRIVANDLLPRLSPGVAALETVRPTNLIINIDGEEHPIQLDRPLVLRFGERQRTVIVRQAP